MRYHIKGFWEIDGLTGLDYVSRLKKIGLYSIKCVSLFIMFETIQQKIDESYTDVNIKF